MAFQAYRGAAFTALLALGLLTAGGACSKKVDPSEADKSANVAPATTTGAVSAVTPPDVPTVPTKKPVAVQEGAEQGDKPVSGTATPALNAFADPGCEGLCTETGYCKMKDGSCAVGGVEHCRQSFLCRVRGACSVKQRINDDGRPFLTCTAATDADCKDSEDCQQKGKCRALDGFCTNVDDSQIQKYRADKVEDVRKLTRELTESCEDTKSKTLALFRRGGVRNPSLAWTEGEDLDRETWNVLIDFRREMLWQYGIVEKQVEGDKDLLGHACASTLRDGITKARSDCFFKSKKQQLGWLRRLGDNECGIK